MLTQYFKERLKKFNYQDFFKSLLWAIIIAVVFRTFLFEPFRIPSGSMIPTLQVGDYLFTSKYSYGYSKYSFPFGFGPFAGRIFKKMPKRGDVIVFKGVKDPETFYIKRLIGLPGDEIQLLSGKLYINGKPVMQTELGKTNRESIFGQVNTFTEIKETLDTQVSYTTLLTDTHDLKLFPNQTIMYKVPQDHFFFLGDNRNNSVDSRYLDGMGYIPFDNLVGRADFLLFTSDFSIVEFLKTSNTNRALTLIK